MSKPQGITRYYIRHYRDNGQTTAYCEWSDGSRTEGHAVRSVWLQRNRIYFDAHITSLAQRAIRDGLSIETEVW